MNHSRIIDSWVAELRLGARNGRRKASALAQTPVADEAREPEEPHAARPFALRLTRDSAPSRKLSPCWASN